MTPGQSGKTNVRVDSLVGGLPVTSSIIAAISRPSSCTPPQHGQPVGELEVRRHGVLVGWMRNDHERLHLDSEKLDDGIEGGL